MQDSRLEKSIGDLKQRYTLLRASSSVEEMFRFIPKTRLKVRAGKQKVEKSSIGDEPQGELNG